MRIRLDTRGERERKEKKIDLALAMCKKRTTGAENLNGFFCADLAGRERENASFRDVRRAT